MLGETGKKDIVGVGELVRNSWKDLGGEMILSKIGKMFVEFFDY